MSQVSLISTPPQPSTRKNTTQTISITVGGGLFVLGLCGLLFSSFMGLHFGPLQSLIIVSSGVLLLYNGLQSKSKASYYTCLSYGLFFGIVSILGFVFGQPGNPHVGHEAKDDYLIRIIPNIQELGVLDHSLHAGLAIILLIGAYDWSRTHQH